MEKATSGTSRMVRLAVLIAVIAAMAFTPLGYLKTGGLSITLLQIPVVIGAILMGPAAGTVLGLAFGLTSLFQCFGMEPFGTMLMSINPLGTVIGCTVPRVLMGYFSGLLFKALEKAMGQKLFPCAISCLAGALLNTVFFMGLLILFFYNTDYIQSIVTALGASSPLSFVIAFVGINGAVEAVVCCVVGGALSRVLYRFK